VEKNFTPIELKLSNVGYMGLLLLGKVSNKEILRIGDGAPGSGLRAIQISFGSTR
jgi:hypothetical protein